MKKARLILSAASLLMCSAALAQAPAFPGAEGSGRYVTGGRGGKVIHVTNLNDSGAGSLREALKGNDKKIIVFDVGGVIPLQKELNITSNTTILGQTAPYPGITLRYYTTEIKGDNIIVRFLRFRRGQERDVDDGADTFWGRRHTGIIIDHCSMSWSIDEIGSFYDNNNFTLQWCVYGESLNNAGHGKGSHGYGGIWGGKLASFHHNMIAHTNNRAPRFNGARYNWQGYTGNALYTTYNWANAVQAENVDFRNCLIFDWGGGGCYGGPGGGYINMVNNYYKSTPETSNKNRVTTVSIANSTTTDEKIFLNMTSRYFISGNYVYGDRYGANYDWKGVKYDDGIVAYNGDYYSRDSLNAYGDGVEHYNINGGKYVKIKLDKEVEAPVGTVTTHSAEQAYAKVMAYAGASQYRDDVDARYMKECANDASTYKGSVTKTAGRIDVVADCDGYTEKNFPTGKHAEGFDSDQDGMPDAWETANGLNPKDASDANAYTLDGKGYYTNLEVYANSLVEDIVKAQNKDATNPVDEYYPSCKKADGLDYYTGRIVERVTPDTTKTDSTQIKEQKIYTTTFADWTDEKANASSPVTVTKSTLFTNENLTFSIFNTQVSSTNKNTAKFPSWQGGYLMASKAADPYVTTSALKSITKVHFMHGATGSKRGWKLEVKGDGDNDWVTVSNAFANPSSGADVTVDINRKNCQLRFTNLNSSQNAYLFQLDIYGNVDMTGKDTPEFSVNYYDVDGKLIDTQKVKQDEAIGSLNDGKKVTVATGRRFRGWLMKAGGEQKATANTIVTGDLNLYPLVSDIEGDEPEERNVYNLKDPFFYVEDHEGFVPTSAYSYNGSQHGLELKPGSIKLKVGGNATIIVESCQFSKSALTLKDGSGKVIGTVDVPATDGVKSTLCYNGPATTLTLNFPDGEVYLHSLSVLTTGTGEIAKNDEGYYVAEPGNGNSLLNILDVIAANEDGTSRVKIFLPDGTYDLGKTVEQEFPLDNISVIGQSMDKTIIVTTPDKSTEGLGSADLFFNKKQNIYFQDITLKNALDYYSAGSAGRAAVIQDRGNHTIYKNVRMLSYQDTYYSQNSNMQSYFDGCDVHGTVDFICGGGDVRFDNTTITLEPRESNGGGGRTITAPTTTTTFGYVFDNCKVVDTDSKGNWNYGRTWQNNPVCVWLNTTLDPVAEKTIVKSRWTAKGMNNRDPKVFGEYGTKDEDGADITPSSNKIVSYGGTVETILTADEASAYDYDKMFTGWDPRGISSQLSVSGVTIKDGTLSWNAAAGATAYAVFKDGNFQAITSSTSYPGIDGDGEWSVRAANAMGGFGEAAKAGVYSGIATLDVNDADAIASVERYSIDGKLISKNSPMQPEIVKMKWKNGTTKVKKIIKR